MDRNMEQFPGSKLPFFRYGGDPESEVDFEFGKGPPVLCNIMINLDQLLIRELPPEDRKSEKPLWAEAVAFAARIAVQCIRNRRRR